MFRIFLIVLCLLAGASGAEAQFTVEQQRPQIELSPAFPEPGATVEATLNAYSFATDGARIQWFVDGIEQTENRNSNSTSFPAGELGTERTITVQLTMADGRVLTGSKDIIPTRVDIVIEADTTIPMHYRGRALPSSGSTVRAVAIPQLANQSGALSYKWTFDTAVLGGGSYIGNDTVSFEAPKSGAGILRVDVIDTRGVTIAQKSILVPALEPELYFYVYNPLRGLSQYAITEDYTLVGEELVIRAEPYYMDENIFARDPRVEWEINGQEVSNPSNDPQQITLRRSEGSGSFTVSFHLLNREALIQNIREDITVTF